MSKKSKKRKRGPNRKGVRQQKGIHWVVQQRAAEVEYMLRCCFVPMENRTPEGIAVLAETIYRDKIA